MARDDDDDRPRRRRPRDDEDDDRPRRRRRDEDEEDEDDRPRVRRKAPRDQDEDDYDDRPRRRRRKKKETPLPSVPGILALVCGLMGLALAFTCGAIGIVPAVIGLGIGIVGLLMAQKSRGRQSLVLPISGSAVSLVATIVSLVFLVSFFRTVKEIQKDFKEGMEQAAKAEAERKTELAKAPQQVKNATPDSVVRVNAAQFYQLWDDDEDQFDRLYKNKVVEVTGTVDELNFQGDTYTVMLKAGADGETVDCQFAKDPGVRERLAQLRPGQAVTIRGKCLGGFADLEACILVE
jgi:hypothetical protein